MDRTELEQFLNSYLQISNFDDYCPNGLQIEGQNKIKKIAFSVSATKESIQKAIQAQADTLIVHHGLFWKFHGPKTITGAFAKRIIPLIEHKINLFAYHLPLDGHQEIGNAVSIANLLKMQNMKPFAEGKLRNSYYGIKAEFKTPLKSSELKMLLEKILNHTVLMACENPEQVIKSLGIITGGANSDWKLALKDNLDAYLTGEMSEHDWHESKEAGITMYAGGHHATEEFGIQALQKLIEDKFKIETIYLSSDNQA
jgi:dinuclear metal center YbgI/SA1388 family protein